MRFFADGPSIPDELLEQRDRGNVVFFCGAGVSKPAGLPGFAELARRVMKTLGTGADAPSRTLLESPTGIGNLDRVFNLLQQEYRRDRVEAAVARILRTPRGASSEHSTILRLSRGLTRRVQVVTTNFDHLFERADKRLRTHVAPSLPDLSAFGPFEGVVYLHGRQNGSAKSTSIGPGLVLGSSDFGRAYLADGWATKFVRDLVQQYVIVLVGYSASDPPIRYLLEGLHLRRGEGAATIYAFDQGGEGEVASRWRGLGVQALPYAVSNDASHTILWNTLRAWAERADDVDAWRRSVVALSRRSPAELEPFQRGQVASLVRTSDGAALFAGSEPPPHPEWLCVFDSRIRWAEPIRSFGTSEPEIDSLEVYGFDDDPPRPPASHGNNEGVAHRVGAVDLLALSTSDERTDRNKRLAGISARHSDPLPARLGHLAGWIGSVCRHPITIWWAAGCGGLHHQTLRAIEWHLQRSIGDDLSRRAWSLLLEHFHHAPTHPHEGWHAFKTRLVQEGWTLSVIRDFERAIQPVLGATRSSAKQARPPVLERALQLEDLARLEVIFPGYDRTKLEVPTEHLPVAFEIIRRALLRAGALLAEIGTDYWNPASLIEDDDDEDGRSYLSEASKYVFWAKGLFDRLAVEHPQAARMELSAWPTSEPYFFSRLAIYAWTKPGILSGPEVARALTDLPKVTFWEYAYRRELLRTLRAKWQEWTGDEKMQIEERILAGRDKWEREEEAEHKESVARTAATMLGWLERQECHLSGRAQDRLAVLRQSIPGWNASWDERADFSSEIRSGWVIVDSDPAVLLDVPLSEAVASLGQPPSTGFGFKRHAPFDGLVAQRPARALAMLRFAERRDGPQLMLWRTLLSDWPAGASARLITICAHRLMRLPDSTLVWLRRDVSRWFRERAEALYTARPACAYGLFDRIAQALSTAPDHATQSGIGEVSIGGRVLERSRRTYDHAINGPVGHLADGLFQLLGKGDPAAGNRLPSEIESRLHHLFRSSGEGADHAVSQATRRLPWLHYVDPAWTKARLLPLLAADSHFAEPAWSGLLYNQVPSAELFGLMKRDLLQIFEIAASWHWDSHPHNRLIDVAIIACYWRRNDRRYLSYADVRPLLRVVNDDARARALWNVARVVQEQDAWDTFGKPFLRHAWPQESRFQTPMISQRLADVAEHSGDRFPDVVKTIAPILVPSNDLDLTIHGLVEEGGTAIASRFPLATLDLLALLVPDAPVQIPYGLDKALRLIATAALSTRDDPKWRRLNRIAARI